MFRSFMSEWVKLRRRAVLAAGASMSGLAVLLTYMGMYQAVNPGRPPRAVAIARLGLESSYGLASALARGGLLIVAISLILVAAVSATEYSQGTIRVALANAPGRLRWLTGKFLAVVSFTFIATTLAFGLAVVAGIAAASARDISTQSWFSDTGITSLAQVFGDTLIAEVAWSAFGLFCAIIVRSAGPAIGIALAYSLIVENLVAEIFPDTGAWLFGRLTFAVVSGNGVVPAPNIGSTYERSLTLMMIYTVVLLGASAMLFAKRDVTS